MPREEYFAAVRDAGLTEIEILSDIDGVALFGGEVPGEILEMLERTGTSPEELRGKVRSVTYRAVKPLSA